jgi:spectinomycin phosphotransferase
MGEFAVSVFTFLEGTSFPYGEFSSPEMRHRVLHALGRMHAATSRMPSDLPRRDCLEITNRSGFDAVRRDLDRPWSAGPYAEVARLLVRDSTERIDEMFARYDVLVPPVLSTSDSWVVTHGEPHAANTMTTVDGRLAMIDWDTVLLAPRERDLWMLDPLDDTDWAAYEVAATADSSTIELYRLAWDLSEICGYASAFHAPHADDANTRVAWRSLRGYLTVDE